MLSLKTTDGEVVTKL
jgi:hypothetical protein